MKKPFLLCILLMTITFFSCGSDDDGINNSIVGTWKLTNLADEDFVPIVLLDCEKETTYVFTDNTLNRRNFEGNQDETGCLPVEETNANYRIVEDRIEFLDDNGNVVTSDESQFTFSIGADTLTILDSDPTTNEVVLTMVFDRQ